MELDSPSSTPPQSPASVSIAPSDSVFLPDPTNTRSGLRPGPPEKDLSASCSREHRSDDRPAPILSQLPASAANNSRKNTLRPIAKPIIRPIPTGPALRSLMPTNPFVAQAPIARVGSQENFISTQMPATPPLQPTARISANLLGSLSRRGLPAKRKPVMVNPFVSAGFMTEFVGSSGPNKPTEPAVVIPPPLIQVSTV